MSLIDHIYLLQSVHHHIEHKSTGTPKDFASRLGISERKLYRVLDELRDVGAEITFSAERSSYIYCNEVKINIYLRIEQNDKVRMKGGSFSKNLDLLPFLAVGCANLDSRINWEESPII